MTREELKEHCKRQIQQFERVEKIMPVTPNDWKRYEEHKLVLELLEQELILDKIRSEVAQMDFDFGDSYNHTSTIIEMVLEVIDKHKSEIEPQKRENKEMIDEISNVKKYFKGSYINKCRELIISERGNVYFIATNCKDKKDVICRLLEWCSRPIAKGEPYATNTRNIEWRKSLLCDYNNYLGTNFTLDDMYWIYDKLGNAVNHELTLEFIHSNYDLSLVRPKERSDKE